MDKNMSAFLRPDAHTVQVQFVNTNNETSTKLYTYLVTGKLKLVIGDLVTVPTMSEDTSRVSVAKVHTVDPAISFGPNSDKTYKWVIGKVDTTDYEMLMAENKRLEELYTQAARRNLQKGYASQILADLPAEDRAELESVLGIVDTSSTLEHKQ